MRILLLADHAEPTLWEHLDRKKLQDVDLIISCGDLPASYLSFLTCFTNAPILYVHGNHDTRYAKNPPEGCICIEDSIYRFQGLRILGLGGSMCYNQKPHQYTEKQMAARIRKLWLKIWFNKGFDLLITHAPAFELGDDKDLAHRGFVCFRRLIEKHHPQYMVHGHVHQSYRYDFQRERAHGTTTIINAYGHTYLDF